MPPSASITDVLRSWHDFFLLVGGASATLLGLVFVSLTLVMQLPTMPDDNEQRIFAAPILLHFAYAIMMAALCLAPWQQLMAFGGAIMLIALVTLRKAVILCIQLWQRQKTMPVSRNTWIHLGIAPLLAALLCAASGGMLLHGDPRGVIGVATAAFSLDVMALFSAWNLFLWLVKEHRRGITSAGPPAQP
jgi:hypothetical protein